MTLAVFFGPIPAENPLISPSSRAGEGVVEERRTALSS